MSDFFAPAALSVSELNAYARQLLEDNLIDLWVGGEVSNLTRAASGHFYFSLKDARAQVRCVLFKGVAQQLSQPLQEGDHIEVAGKISIYEARGEFQITINAVRHKGLGQLYEAYERLKQQLTAEGLFSKERKRPLPVHPKVVGVVTSLAAAALRDVVTTLRRRHSVIRVIVYPTAVQGAGSERQIAAAITSANQQALADVLIICRGGGSIEDLWSYNEEIVVRTVADSTIPTVSGVGHETDFTLTDFAADVRAPTPTAAAELVSPDMAQLRHNVTQWQKRIHQLLEQRYYDASQKLDWLARQLKHPQQNWQQQQQQLRDLARLLQIGMQRQIRQHRQNLIQQQRSLENTRPQTIHALQALEYRKQQLHQIWQNIFMRAQQRLQQQTSVLQAVSPLQILARGYSVVTNQRGQVIRDANKLKTGQYLNIRFAGGERSVQVAPPKIQSDLFDN
ncbi:exodeoxyribonuclease VII large subunit [Snodgrassella alvi]|uniref:exodeoxyribonuclease VII large subunit n=1 Tax=Snodgrassella alvi TaxID=1196083 RepID=UPI000A02E2AD|nr:exodeoxyribonuclease VII large subunit [Snodgrassella alvi]ORF00066.1 exodeoxyribonuclease VII large subunit [Snodgrassella alvi]ORF06686.1 exodeoxyribonuclease VII large subunit [Snodgrassella alvi]ORF10158.1 exodeoxyribonuclease VII large subunit [Snodgrassella alvi]ORF11422.1 exodeoxyribonuclease VII large subunit [Snodgrassella alvi]ORF20582.1 exodeoxyribonuclease VII large subunit [Snodgrassella alvi]